MRTRLLLTLVLLLMSAQVTLAVVQPPDVPVTDGEIPAYPADNIAFSNLETAVVVPAGSVGANELVVPVANDDTYDTPTSILQVPAPGLLANDSGDAAGTLEVKTFTNPTNGTVTVRTDGSFDYEPNLGFTGTDSFEYRIGYVGETDPRSDLATVTINVSGQNNAPTANPDEYIATVNTPLQIDAPGLLTNDSDPDGQNLSIQDGAVTPAANGQLQVFTNGAFVYTPNDQFIGIDRFTYYNTDGALTSAPVTVTITVVPTSLALIAPRSNLQQTYGNPEYIWPNLGDAEYQIYLAESDDIYARKAWVTVNAADVCDAQLCTVDLTDFDGNAWLLNGGYQVWLYSDAEGWNGPFGFSVNATAPDFPTLGPVENADTLRPDINWTLSGDSLRSSWFQIYLAPSDDLSDAVNPFTPINGMWWISREDACGSYESTQCTLPLNVDLEAGRSYNLYMQAWNPGGITTGGLNGGRWSNPLTFTVGQ